MRGERTASCPAVAGWAKAPGAGAAAAAPPLAQIGWGEGSPLASRAHEDLSPPWSHSLLVSIPGAALATLRLPGSIFAWRHIRDAVTTPELALALRLVMADAAARRIRVRFMARPEIFTHGASRAWLDARLGDTADHLALTDGGALRTIPGLANHVFFVSRGLPAAEAALRRLVAVIPEVFAGLAGQVNGALSFRLGARWVRPPTIALRFATTPPAPDAPLRLPFLAHPAARGAMEPATEAPSDPRPLHFIPLSETALADAPFVTTLAHRLQRAALGADDHLPVLLLPHLETEQGSAAALAATLRTLAASGVPFPRAPTWSVRVTTVPPAPAELSGGRVTLHPSIPFWRFGADLLAAPSGITLSGSGALAPHRALLAGWLGREVTITRPADSPFRTPVSLGTVP